MHYAFPSSDKHFFSFVFDTEWVMSTCEHQGRDTVLQTGLKIHWSRRSASSCFNRVWRVTESSAKHHALQSIMLFYLLILPSLSFSLSFSNSGWPQISPFIMPATDWLWARSWGASKCAIRPGSVLNRSDWVEPPWIYSNRVEPPWIYSNRIRIGRPGHYSTIPGYENPRSGHRTRVSGGGCVAMATHPPLSKECLE